MREKPSTKQIGPLNVLDFSGQEGKPVCILFHGYGAGKEDLAGLCSYLQLPLGTRYIFPDGIINIDLGYYQQGKAWFPIDFTELERARNMGNSRDMSKAAPAGLDSALKSAQEFIAELKVPAHNLILGGFSQGAMLATELVLNMRETPAGLIILSGTLLSAEEWQNKASLLAGFRFFQCHGKNDMILPYSMAIRLNETLNKAGMKGELFSFDGGHEIPPHALEALNRYLRDLVPDKD